MHDTTFLVDALSDAFYPHLLATEDLGSHIEYYKRASADIVRLAITEDLRRFDDDLALQAPKDWKIEESKPRTLLTLAGTITYKRRAYIDTYGNRRYLLDEVLGIPPYKRIESNAFLWIVRRAADMSYKKVADAFLEMTGAAISKQTIMRCVHEEGDLLEAAARNWAGGSPHKAQVLFTEFDGFWVHLQSPTKQHPMLDRKTYKEQFKKKSMELKVWVAYAGKHGNKRIHPIHWASVSEPEAFFSECMDMTAASYDLEALEFCMTNSDAAGWCKNHALDSLVDEKVSVLSKLDVYHVNQKVYRAFSSEVDRSYYLDLLYSRDFDGLIDALECRIEAEPDDERIACRTELKSYIQDNLDWLMNGSLSKFVREKLLDATTAFFADRPFVGHLHEILRKRRYTRFLFELEQVVIRCSDARRVLYARFCEIATKLIDVIKGFGQMTMGTMEGTNSKVYASRLKVWGCSWSKKGALAMMRIRATLFSGKELIAPSYNQWFNEQEKDNIKTWMKRSIKVPESVGSGWEVSQASIPHTSRKSPKMYGLIYGGV